MISLILTAALAGAPVAADDDGSSPAPSAPPRSGFSQFSEGGLSKTAEEEEKRLRSGSPKKAPGTSPSTTTTPGPETRKDPRAGLSEEAKAELRQRTRQEITTKKAIDQARDETASMLDEVRGVLSDLEQGASVRPNITVLPPPGEAKGPGCDLELPQILAFELQRIRAVRDEAQLMLEMHEANLKIVQDKLDELEQLRVQLDTSREALEQTLGRKSLVDDEKEKERRRLRLLMSSQAMKPKKIAALMNEISLEEARVLLEALDDNTAKAVLEALSPERLAQIVSDDDKKSARKPTEPTTTATKPKETL